MRKKSDFELIESQGGKYALVMGVTRRARQLNDGARPLVEQHTLNNVATAIDEVAQGRIKVLAPSMPTRPSPLRAMPVEALEGNG
jgi:DNA-directed RNA polymerase omega subunit